MKTIVRYEFDNTSFFPRSSGKTFFEQIDPPVIPATGDVVHIRLEDFFEDPELLKAYNDFTAENIFFAERVNTTIGKNEIEVIVVLYEEEAFKSQYPRFF